MRLYFLPLGACDCDKGKVLTPGRDEGVRIMAPVWAALIQSGGVNILVDTGMHPVHVEDPDHTWGNTDERDLIKPVMTKQDYVVSRLHEIEVHPDDIRYVINTHLHFDHAGCNASFPSSEFIVQQDHYEHAIAHPEECPHEFFRLPNLVYRGISGDKKLAEGVDIVRTPGHTPGHQSVVVRLPESGTIILCSDAIYLEEAYRDNYFEGTWNTEESKKSAARLAEIAEKENGKLIFGHDPEQWKTIKKAPGFYS